MSSRDIRLRLIVLVAVYAFVISNTVLYLQADEAKAQELAPPEKGWVTLSGILVAADKDNLGDTDWKELALEDVYGQLTLLIGASAQRLIDSIDKYAVLTGVYKPSMSLKGKRVPVLEVRFIDLLEE